MILDITHLLITFIKNNFVAGSSGKSIYVTANYVRLSTQKDMGVFEYHVNFSPAVHSKAARVKIINSHIDQMGGVKMFDGGSCLYLPIRLPKEELTFTGTHPFDDEEVTMTVTFKKKKNTNDCTHLFNILFKRIMVALEYTRFGRNYYNMNNKMLIPQYRMEILPGYVIVAEEYDGGLMICLDAQHKVLRVDTAYEVMQEIRRVAGNRFKEEVHRVIIGSSVMTRLVSGETSRLIAIIIFYLSHICGCVNMEALK